MGEMTDREGREEIHVLIFDNFEDHKLTGTRHELRVVDATVRYTWDAPTCPPGYIAFCNILFLWYTRGVMFPPQSLGTVLPVGREGRTRWTYRNIGKANILCAVLFPVGCAADDFNYAHIGVKSVGNRLGILFNLYDPGVELQLRWRTFPATTSVEQQIVQLEDAVDVMKEKSRSRRGLAYPGEGWSFPLETRLLWG